MKSDASEKTTSLMEGIVQKIHGAFSKEAPKEPAVVACHSIPKCYQGWANGEASLGPKQETEKRSL